MATEQLAAGSLESGQVLLSFAHWLAADEALAALEEETVRKQRAARVLERRALDLSEITDSPYTGLVARCPGKTRTLRTEESSGANLDCAVDQLMATLYRRVPMIAPELLRVGIAQADNDFCYVSVLDVMSVRDQEPQRAVMVPGDGQTRVPLCLAKEYPDPRPAGAVAVAGYPITLSWHDSLEVTAILEAARGSQVECWVSTPSAPANFSRPDSASSVCLLPKKPLERKTMYTVTVTAGETTWSWSLTTR